MKTKKLSFRLASVAMIIMPLIGYSQEYDDLYFSKKDRTEQNKRVLPKKEQETLSNQVIQTDPQVSYSERNINPEFVSRYSVQERELSNEQHLMDTRNNNDSYLNESYHGYRNTSNGINNGYIYPRFDPYFNRNYFDDWYWYNNSRFNNSFYYGNPSIFLGFGNRYSRAVWNRSRFGIYFDSGIGFYDYGWYGYGSPFTNSFYDPFCNNWRRNNNVVIINNYDNRNSRFSRNYGNNRSRAVRNSASRESNARHQRRSTSRNHVRPDYYRRSRMVSSNNDSQRKTRNYNSSSTSRSSSYREYSESNRRNEFSRSRESSNYRRSGTNNSYDRSKSMRNSNRSSDYRRTTPTNKSSNTQRSRDNSRSYSPRNKVRNSTSNNNSRRK